MQAKFQLETVSDHRSQIWEQIIDFSNQHPSEGERDPFYGQRRRKFWSAPWKIRVHGRISGQYLLSQSSRTKYCFRMIWLRACKFTLSQTSTLVGCFYTQHESAWIQTKNILQWYNTKKTKWNKKTTLKFYKGCNLLNSEEMLFVWLILHKLQDLVLVWF